MSTVAPHLSPRLIAKPLEDLRAWQLPNETDLVGTHRGVLRVLVATDALASLELPLDMRAPRLEDTREITHWEMIAKLLEQAEGTLGGAAHCQRIAHLQRIVSGPRPGAGALAPPGRRAALRIARARRLRVPRVGQGRCAGRTGAVAHGSLFACSSWRALGAAIPAWSARARACSDPRPRARRSPRALASPRRRRTSRARPAICGLASGVPSSRRYSFTSIVECATHSFHASFETSRRPAGRARL